MAQLQWNKSDNFIDTDKSLDLRHGNTNYLHLIMDHVRGIDSFIYIANRYTFKYILNFKGISKHDDNGNKWVSLTTHQLTSDQQQGSIAATPDKVGIITLDGKQSTFINISNGNVTTFDHTESYGNNAELFAAKNAIYLLGGADNAKIYKWTDATDQFEYVMDAQIGSDYAEIIVSGETIYFIGCLQQSGDVSVRNRTINKVNITNKSIEQCVGKIPNVLGASFMYYNDHIIGFGAAESGFPEYHQSNVDDLVDLNYNDIFIVGLNDGIVQKTGFKMPKICAEYHVFIDEEDYENQLTVFGYMHEFQAETNWNIPVVIAKVIGVYYVKRSGRVHALTDDGEYYWCSITEILKIKKVINSKNNQ